MVTAAHIELWGKAIAAIAWNPKSGVGSLEFLPAYFETNWDISPILLPKKNAVGRVFSFPNLRDNSTFQGLPGVLADILPDRYGNALINSWLAKNGRASESLNPIEKLCFIGSRGMGALEIKPTIAPENGKSATLELDSLVEAARYMLNQREGFKSSLDQEDEKAMVDILKIGTSAGGARAKAIIAYHPKTQEVRSGQGTVPAGFEHWLLKFDGVHDALFGASGGYGRVEMAYYLMAKAAGIQMMPCQLIEEHGRAHFLTKRFDRHSDGSKIHIQSWCGMRHFDFNEVHSFSYEQLFETMRMLGMPYPDAEALFRRMAFNVMSRNCDDHTKNFSFTMQQDGRWRLSPAYDICHAYRPGSEWVSQHALSLNGKKQGHTKADFLAVARAMNIKKPETILDEVRKAVENWDQFAQEAQVNASLKASIAKTFWLL